MLENVLIGETVYIVGHKVPDLDSVVSAYAYEVYRHAKGDFNYIGIRCGQINPITLWVFDRWRVSIPPLVKRVDGKKLALIDHTEPDQRPDGWENAEVVEVIDHHNLKLETNSPAKVLVIPYGSTATILARKFIEDDIYITKKVAGLLLSAIIDDTTAFRSPVTVKEDKLFAGKMASRAGIEDISAYTRKLMHAKDIWMDMEVEKLVFTDIKEYQIGTNDIYISQVETTRGDEIDKKRSKEIREYLEELNKEFPAEARLIMITDILTSKCVVIVVGEKKEKIASIFATELVDGYKMYLPGVISRKKQIVPTLMENLD